MIKYHNKKREKKIQRIATTFFHKYTTSKSEKYVIKYNKKNKKH